MAIPHNAPVASASSTLRTPLPTRYRARPPRRAARRPSGAPTCACSPRTSPVLRTPTVIRRRRRDRRRGVPRAATTPTPLYGRTACARGAARCSNYRFATSEPCAQARSRSVNCDGTCGLCSTRRRRAAADDVPPTTAAAARASTRSNAAQGGTARAAATSTAWHVFASAHITSLHSTCARARARRAIAAEGPDARRSRRARRRRRRRTRARSRSGLESKGPARPRPGAAAAPPRRRSGLSRPYRPVPDGAATGAPALQIPASRPRAAVDTPPRALWRELARARRGAARAREEERTSPAPDLGERGQRDGARAATRASRAAARARHRRLGSRARARARAPARVFRARLLGPRPPAPSPRGRSPRAARSWRTRRPRAVAAAQLASALCFASRPAPRRAGSAAGRVVELRREHAVGERDAVAAARARAAERAVELGARLVFGGNGGGGGETRERESERGRGRALTVARARARVFLERGARGARARLVEGVGRVRDRVRVGVVREEVGLERGEEVLRVVEQVLVRLAERRIAEEEVEVPSPEGSGRRAAAPRARDSGSAESTTASGGRGGNARLPGSAAS